MRSNPYDPVTGRRLLREGAYGDDSKLRQRGAIWLYHRPLRDLFADGLALVHPDGDWRDGERVLDVGCGNGNWLRRLPEGVAGVGLDLAPGMLDAVRPLGRPLVEGDATALPLADATFDVAVAMHMLYHVPDIPAAVAELRRVLRPGGVALASTNGAGSLAEMDALVCDAAGLDVRPSLSLGFTVQNAPELLGAAFASVAPTVWHGELVVPEVAPVVAYVDSMRDPVEPQLPAGRTWADVLAEAERLVTDRIASHGAFRTRTEVGVFRCT